MAVTANVYPWFIKRIGNKEIDLDTDVFKIILGNSSMTYNAAHDDLADITANQLATANGYTSGGATLGSVTWSLSSPDNFWDAANPTWTASGGSISADTAAIYDDTHANDALAVHIDFGGNQSAGDGTQLVINFNASGIMKI